MKEAPIKGSVSRSCSFAACQQNTSDPEEHSEDEYRFVTGPKTGKSQAVK